jgi:EAL and modified HD-GYP domain-containing signal transduction protein
LPKDKFIVQIQLRGQVAGAEIDKYTELYALRYKLAFSGINSGNTAPEIFKFAQYCKFDPEEKDEAFLRGTMTANKSISFIATGVDSFREVEAARSQGFSLFQGYFFKQPSIVKKTKEIDPLKVNYLRLIELTSTDEYSDFSEISALISSDMALSYKLLRLLNSAALGLRNRISSISAAVTYLGEANLKKWIAMLALRGLADDKPAELIRMSLIRAQFGEYLNEQLWPRRNGKHVFLLGLFSMLDVALEKSNEDVFQEISVADEIESSVLTDSGPYSDLVKFFTDYEYANWEEVGVFTSANRLTDILVNNAYMAAVKWYSDLVKESIQD